MFSNLSKKIKASALFAIALAVSFGLYYFSLLANQTSQYKADENRYVTTVTQTTNYIIARETWLVPLVYTVGSLIIFICLFSIYRILKTAEIN